MHTLVKEAAPHMDKNASPSQTKERPVWNVGKILLCTDFSQNAEAARDCVIRLCNSLHASAVALNVCECAPRPANNEEDLVAAEMLYSDRSQKLSAVADALKAKGVAVETLMLVGNPSSLILEYISEQPVDLIVLGTRARKGAERFLFGSTAEAVFRRANCPVLTIGIAYEPPNCQELTGPVVVATDFADGADESVRFALSVANAFHAPLHCIHVLPTGTANSDGKIVETIMLEALTHLTTGAGSCEREPVHKVLYDTDVSHSVVDYARAHHAQMIVLGIRKKPKVASHLPQQRTYRVITAATCPVITIPCKHDHVIQLAAACL